MTALKDKLQSQRERKVKGKEEERTERGGCSTEAGCAVFCKAFPVLSVSFSETAQFLLRYFDMHAPRVKFLFAFLCHVRH